MARLDPDKIPHHIAIIPDGNGRWAQRRGLPRSAGYRAGTETVRETVRAAHELGVGQLTFYGFSTENWSRPSDEVRAIMQLIDHYIATEAEELIRNGIKVEAIGRLHDIDAKLRGSLEKLIERTENHDEMRVTLAISYSGRAEIADAARQIARAVEAGKLDPEAIDEKCFQAHLYAPDMPDPDLLIRAGDEQRVSNFMLWQLAYTELWMSEQLWPDFSKSDLVEAILAYQTRERRFGKTGEQVKAGR